MTLKEAAKTWADVGLKIVPVKLSLASDGKKKVSCLWKWRTDPYPGFDNLNWRGANGYGMVLGQTPKGWLACIDCDNDAGHDPYTALTKAFPDLTATYIERSPNGFHFFLWIDRPIDARNINIKTKNGLELHINGLVFMAPSSYEGGQYQVYNAAEILRVPDFYQQFQRMFDVPKTQVDIGFILNGVIEGERNEAAIKLASWYRRRKHLKKQETKKKLLEWNSKNTPPISVQELLIVLESAYRNVEPYHYFFSNEPSGEHRLDPSENEFWLRGVFQPVAFAEYLISKYYIKTDRDDDAIYVYNPTTGIYLPTGESVIVEEMAVELGEQNRNRYFSDVKHHIHGKTYFDRPKKPNAKIALFNGLLDVQTGEITSFTPKEFVTIQVPITYVQAADCPKIRKFIEEIVGEEQGPLIQEFIGYCLYPGYPLHKALMLVGGGANGKTTLIKLITWFLGSQNVTSLSLQELCSDRFAPAQLKDKLANLCADLPDKGLQRTGQFKMLTGNDPMSSAQKFRDYLHWINRAKMMFSTNRVPETSDDTIAFFRRWEIVECANYFPPDEQDPNILKKICTPTEMSGLLNFALEGLHRLLKKGGFSNPVDYDEMRKVYIRKSNSARAFIEENLKFDVSPNSYISERELYEKYVLWCRQNNLPVKRKGELTQNIHQHLPEAKQSTEYIDKEKTIHVWRYVALSELTTTHINTEKRGIKKKVEKSLDSIVDKAFSKDSQGAKNSAERLRKLRELGK